MVAAVRQTIKVEANGRIEILAPEFRAGTVAEVIVLFPSAIPADQSGDRADALARLRTSIGLSAQAADEWVQDVSAERNAWNPAAEK